MKKLLLPIALSISVLAGCATSSGNSRVTNIGSMGDISIVPKSVKSQRVNNLLVAQAVFHNSGSSNITGFYRCRFFDANQMQISGDQVWQPVTIYQNSEQPVKCMATDVEATDFKFEFSADGSKVTALQ